MNPDANKQKWIDEVYRLMVDDHKPANPQEYKNLLEWAQSLAEGGGSYFDEGLTAQEAYDEEMSCL